ncbi:hypothetical protein VTN02DRAFT_5396 [Thermoascus thermophilus]
MAFHMNSQACASSSKDRDKPHLLSLPGETLKAIFEYAEPKDLAILARVSRCFRDLAAAQLYRTFAHVLADDDSSNGQAAVDRLAGILETLTTSDYDYARYIKEISMDTASGGDGGERASREFKYQYTCGKLLNTLLLVTLRKVNALETFRWNVRVEISQTVFAALSKISTLHTLHVRLQAGLSLHSASATVLSTSIPPPPAPVSIPSVPHSTHFHHHHHHHHLHHPHSAHPAHPLISHPNLSSIYPYMAPKASTSTDVKLTKRLNVDKATHQLQNFSQFSGLKSLAVLDIDSLEYIPDIAQCISSSSSSLKSLKLSFSDSLALKARKKAVVATSDTESVQEDDDFDDLGGLAPPPPPAIVNAPNAFGDSSASTSNEADVRAERAAQEKALAQLFGLRKESASQRFLEHAFEEAIAAADREARERAKTFLEQDEDKLFVQNLRKVTQGISSLKSTKHSKALEKIEKAATKYLDRKQDVQQKKKTSNGKIASMNSSVFGQSGPSKSDATEDLITGIKLSNIMSDSKMPFFTMVTQGGQPELLGTDSKHHPFTTYMQQAPVFAPSPVPLSMKAAKPTSTSKGNGGAVVTSASSPSKVNEGVVSEGSGSAAQTTGVNYKGTGRKSDDELSDLIDLEHPDNDYDAGEDQEFIGDADSSADNESQGSNSGVPLFQDGADGGTERVKTPNLDPPKGKKAVRDPPGLVENSKQDRKARSGEEVVKDYLRQNHGISLESLSIHLIPVRASVLCRAIDVCSLKHISLLNVGPQRSFWAMLTKIQKTSSLKLTSIHTDNVTLSFLEFLNGLDELTELFMFERSSRSKVESFAAKTSVTIEDIRKQVLKKHCGHLTRLVIRNNEGPNWALNRRSVLLITKFGSKLVELAVGLSSSNFVSSLSLAGF